MGIYLNGVGTYIQAQNSEEIDFPELTAMFEVRGTPIRSWKYYLSKNYGQPFGAGYPGFRFNSDLQGNIVNFDLQENATNFKRLQYTGVVLDGKRHTVIGWWDGKTAELWVDGVKQVVAAFSGNINNTLPIVIGGTSGIDSFLSATFFKVAIWNRAIDLSDGVWEGKIPKKGLQLWYPFESNAGVMCKDWSGYGRNGVIHGGKWTVKKNMGWYFDNGGFNFPVSIDLDCQNATIIVIGKFRSLSHFGVSASGRQVMFHPSGDKLMIWNEVFDQCVRTTTYDGIWKALVTDAIEEDKVYTMVGKFKGSLEQIQLRCCDMVLSNVERTDIGTVTPYSGIAIQVGSTALNTYPLHGDVWAVLVYDHALDDDEIQRISADFRNPPREGLVFFVNFLKKTKVPIDEVSGKAATTYGSASPRPVVKSV